MRSNRTSKIIKEIAYNHNFTEKEVYDMVMAPFNLVVEVMRNGDRNKVDFKSVRIISFGTFFMSQGRRNFFNKLNEKLNGEKLQSGTDRPDNQGSKT